MCGIVGLIKEQEYPVTWQEHQDFLAMLGKAQQRGSQATGVIYVYKSGATFCMKSPSAARLATDYIPHRKNVIALLGHTRQSTGGAPKDNENNHPHETKNWALIHNGSCWTDVPDEDLELKTKCDTEEFVRMFDYIAKRDKTATVPVVLKRSLEAMNGSWSLAFINKKNQDIFLTTNGSSPLNCVYFPRGMFFASVAAYFDETATYNLKDGITLGTSIRDSACVNIAIDTVFEPEALSIFKVTNKARLERVIRYTKTERTRYKNYNNNYKNGYYDYWDDALDETSGWFRDKNGRFKGKQDSPNYNDKLSDYFTHKEFKDAANDTFLTASNLRTESDLFKYYEQQLDLLQVNFCIKDEEFEDNLVVATDVLCKIAIYQLIKDPRRAGVNSGQALNLKNNFLEGKWIQPPILMEDAIDDKFNALFIKELTDFIDRKAFVDVPQYIWNLMDSDRNMSAAILEETPWETKVLCLYFGIYFDAMGIEAVSASKAERFYRSTFEEIEQEEEIEEEFPESKLACTTCMIKRVMKTGAKGSVQHVCTNCGSVIIDLPAIAKRVN